ASCPETQTSGLSSTPASTERGKITSGEMSDSLFNAARTAWQNLSTSMNLTEHPRSCECYGCSLGRAATDECVRRAFENTRDIREREKAAEQPSAEIMDIRFYGTGAAPPSPSGVEQLP